MIEGFQVRNDNVMVSHPQYADDTLILCGASQIQIRYLRCILQCFEVVTRLRMNFAKSQLIGVGDVPNIDLVTTDLGCSVG